SDVLRHDRHSTYCVVCRETLNRKSTKRHCRTEGHIVNLKRADEGGRVNALVEPVITLSPPCHDPSTSSQDHVAVHTSFSATGDFNISWESFDSYSHEYPGGNLDEDDATTSVEDAGDSTGSSDSGFDIENADDLFMRLRCDANRLADQLPSTGQQDDDGWETESEDESQIHAFSIYRAPAVESISLKGDLLCHSRRVHFGRTHIKAVLEFARETQGEKIPSYHALRNFQKSLTERIGNPSKRCVSSQGTVYYINQISKAVRQDIANLLVRPHMNFFPHFDGKRMSQVWNGHKMVHDMPNCFLTPCVRFGGRIFYINELVRREADWFIPLRWITVGPDHELHTVGHRVLETPNGLNSFPELQARKAVPAFDENSERFRPMMPHPLRSTAGNVSKQWNKHWSCYLSNGALPQEELQSEYHVRFVSTSSHASPSELMQGIRASIEEAFENPVVAYDCVTHEEVLVRPFPLFWAGDNPMQAEHCSSSGLNSSHFCRTCDVGGPDDYKQSLDRYRTLFSSGNRRRPSETYQSIDERLEMAILPKTIQKVKNHACDTGVKDSVVQPIIDHLLAFGKVLHNPPRGKPRLSPQQVEYALQQELAQVRSGFYVNPLLTMPGVDIHRDTPTEILHTVLLGVVKYYWGQSVFVLEKAKKLSDFESRLASTNISGLDLPKFSASYMCQYRAQLLDGWRLLGRLSLLLWYTAIEDIDSYTEELQSVINDFLLVTAQCSPSIIVLKPKFHFLIHLPMYIKRFGPALLFSTERFESFNGVFRGASMFSNGHAPSRDIAHRFGDLDRVKHVSSGGYWREGNSWVQASNNVLNFASNNKVFGHLIGMPNKTVTVPGSVEPLPKTSVKARVQALTQSWGQFVAAEPAMHGCAPPAPDGGQYFHVLSTTAASGDTIKVGQDFLSCDNQFAQVQAVFGRISGSNQRKYFVAARLYALDSTKHVLLDLPVLIQSETIVCIAVEDVSCAINLQHDCTRYRACTNTRAVYEVQERERTTKVTYRVQHSDKDYFVLNLHAFHNAQIIRKALPNHLYARRPQSTDPEEIFSSVVEKLSIAKLQKVRLAAAKRTAKGVMAEALEEVAAHAGKEGDDTPINTDIIEGLAPEPKTATKRKAQGEASTAKKHQKK
ncbi:hypothetical protein FRC06_000869, partial [Ceratobasidium sp. 370]